MTATLDELDAAIAAALRDSGISYDRHGPGRYFLSLPGTKKLQTNCWLIVTDHALLVEAFVCRRPDESFEAVYRFLLRRNARLYGVHYTLDDRGDIYLVGRIGLHAVTPDELDRLLGQVLEAADGDFNPLLESASPAPSAANGTGASPAASPWPTSAPSSTSSAPPARNPP